MNNKLLWVYELQRSLELALATSIQVTIEDHVDPLKKIITFTLFEDIKKGDFNPIQVMAHSFSKSNDCVIEKIRRGPSSLILNVLTKTRLGPESRKNPLCEA